MDVPSSNLQTLVSEVFAKLSQDNKFAVAVLGDLILDDSIHADHGGIHPETGVPLLENASSQQSIGGAGNIALALSRLGIDAPLFSIIGTDLPGRLLSETQDRLQLQSYLISSRGWPTPQKRWIYERGQNGDLELIQRIDFDHPVPHEIRKQLLGEFRAHYKPQTKVFIVADHGLGTLGSDTCETIALAKEKDAKVVIIPRTWIEDYQQADVLVVNPNEMRSLVGLTGKGEAQAAATQFATKHDVTIFLTLGSRGLFVCSPKQNIEQLVTTTAFQHAHKMGARDMVVAIVAVGLALEISVLEIAQLANVFASLVVQQHGNGTVTWKDLFRALRIPQPEPVTS